MMKKMKNDDTELRHIFILISEFGESGDMYVTDETVTSYWRIDSH